MVEKTQMKSRGSHGTALSESIGRRASIILFAFITGVFVWWLYCAVSYFGSIIPADEISIKANSDDPVIEQHRILTGPGAVTIAICVAIATALLFSARFRARVVSWIRFLANHRRIVFIAMLCWQMVILACFIPAHLRYDARAAQTSSINAVLTPGVFDNYLSTYPNNAFLYLIEYIPTRILYLLSGPILIENKLRAVTIIVFCMQLINIVIVDTSILFLEKTIRPISERASRYAYLFMALLLGCSTWIICPYTDTFSLPLSIWMISLMVKVFNKSKERHIDAWRIKEIVGFVAHFLLIGVSTSLAYAMKPSSVIPLIAFVIVWFVLCLGKSILTKFIPSILAIIIGFGIVAMPLQVAEHTVFNYDSSRSVPMTHYLMMGMKDHGRYNEADYRATVARPTIEEKEQYNLSVIGQRLEDFGPIGYFSFLLKKSYYNSADGSFGDNSYLTVLNGQKGTGWVAVGEKNPIHSHNIVPFVWVQDFLADGEDAHQIYEIIMQAIYILLVLGMLLFSVRLYLAKAKLSDIALEAWIALSLLGGYAFLLIFEGGRTRYLLQFLPLMLFISALGWGRRSQLKSCLRFGE
ncbi:hypothetical protein BMYO_0240 [Bifidobacterium myosotis]|uniref:Glycosyltransferase RgtA/B/C/D-like domain-containing protein n=2 Tax=Bifidobacterium myosotis TaxID=1630166 RepID=A0A261FSE9_9BIFI|nr:hypothetical protein BMYO_0240 [Bifidobacterium myosotis]